MESIEKPAEYINSGKLPVQEMHPDQNVLSTCFADKIEGFAETTDRWGIYHIDLFMQIIMNELY
jgi:hypothetical protein